TPEAVQLMEAYPWPGNIRQLKNITEQMSIIEQDRVMDADTLRKYLPSEGFSQTPMVINSAEPDLSEREILYKVLFDMKNDLNDVKKLVLKVMETGGDLEASEGNKELIRRVFHEDSSEGYTSEGNIIHLPSTRDNDVSSSSREIEVEETLSLQETEKELIKKALQKHRNKRKYAAKELGISERTLYRKIKEYNLT
ncbi:MAG: sigma-54-dependent Fis family transcriptional regulator, partial [Pyrinomonadaceae bacterium]|nr:sigma-54-dependent Fis family transcriptional regulator [Flavobacteriales bacterium]NNE66460.1 sigma-54-dependent Fis family transcriptional regulator [Pyrinomonadaceae bacterium]